MKPIARKIPERPVNGKKSEVAVVYGLTVGELQTAMANFLNSEGYDSEGNEYANLHLWLIKPHGQFIDPTPWQKGDDWNIE